VTSHALKKPVQVRLPTSIEEFLAQTARERGETKSEVVTDALNCLREQRVEALMEEGYRKLGGSQQAAIEAGLTAALPVIPQ
jgi:Arc/MetJ-type ribon-helix-helix transcriptional regulator